MKVIRKRLYEGEGQPSNVRWNDDCECVQTLWGDTWVDTPQADPRYNPAGLAPALETSDPRCDSSQGMRDRIEQIMNTIFLADALIDAANAVFALILIFNPPASLLWRVVIAVLEALYAIGLAALVAEFTEDAYDEMQCIFYEEISPDGTVTQEQFETINTRICDEMSVTICLAMGLILNMLGYVGLSNAGVLAGVTGDCEHCPQNWIYRWNFHDNDGGFVYDSEAGNSGGTWVGGVGNGYQKAYTGIVCAQWDCSRKSETFTIGATTHLISLSIVLDAQSADQCSHIEAYVGSSRTNGFSHMPYMYADTNGTSMTASGDLTNVGAVHVTFSTGNSDGTGDFYSIEIAGTGIPPSDLQGGEFV